MKKQYYLVGALLVTLGLTGCKDAYANLEDKTPVVTVGNQTITKSDVYNLLRGTVGATSAITNANNMIAESEIEITEDMKKTAQETLDNYKSLYGETFTEYLESSGLSEEDYINDYLLPSLQAEKLNAKYVEDNYDEIVKKLTPVKAIVLMYSTSDDANAALSALKDGSKTPQEAATEFNSYSTGEPEIYTTESSTLDAIVRSVIFSANPDTGWTYLPAADGTTHYVMHVEENDVTKIADEVKESLSTSTEIQDEAASYFFKKHGFHVYDKVLYDIIKANYPDNLVQ